MDHSLKRALNQVQRVCTLRYAPILPISSVTRGIHCIEDCIALKILERRIYIGFESPGLINAYPAVDDLYAKMQNIDRVSLQHRIQTGQKAW